MPYAPVPARSPDAVIAAIGLGVLFVAAQVRRLPLTPGRTALVEGGACFWHLVDRLWIFLFALRYLVS